MKLNDLQNKFLLSDEVGIHASKIAKQKKIRDLVHKYQVNIAYNKRKLSFGKD